MYKSKKNFIGLNSLGLLVTRVWALHRKPSSEKPVFWKKILVAKNFLLKFCAGNETYLISLISLLILKLQLLQFISVHMIGIFCDFVIFFLRELVELLFLFAIFVLFQCPIIVFIVSFSFLSFFVWIILSAWLLVLHPITLILSIISATASGSSFLWYLCISKILSFSTTLSILVIWLRWKR